MTPPDGYLNLDELFRRVERLIVRYQESDDAGEVLSADSLADVLALLSGIAARVGEPGFRVDYPIVRLVGHFYWARYLAGNAMADYRAAQGLFRLIAEHGPEHLPDGVDFLLEEESDADTAWNEAVDALGRAERERDLGALDEGIALMRAANAGTPAGSHLRLATLANIHYALDQRYEWTHDLADLDAAVAAGRAAVAEAGGQQDAWRAYTSVCDTLVTRHRRRGDPAALDEAIELARRAVAVAEQGGADAGKCRSHLGLALEVRHALTADPADLAAAVEELRRAVERTADADSHRASRLLNLARVLLRQAGPAGDEAGREEALQASREALVRFGAGPDLAQAPSVAGRTLGDYLRTRERSLLDRAIEAGRWAVAVTPADTEAHDDAVNNLAQALIEDGRARGGSREPLDLLRAQVARRTAAARPEIVATYLMALVDWYETTGLGEALDEAVGAGERAASVHSGHPQWWRCARAAGLAAAHRGRLAGEPADLDDAVRLLTEAHALIPAGEPLAAEVADNLSSVLRMRYEETGDRADLRAAIRWAREAVRRNETPGQLPVYLTNLARALRTHYAASRVLAEVEEAVDAARRAAETMPPADRRYGETLSLLGACLGTAYLHNGEARYADEAVDAGRRALRHTPPAHPVRCIRLLNNATTLLLRYDNTRERADFREATGNLRAAARIDGAAAELRLRAAYTLGVRSAAGDAPQLAAEGYGEAVGLLPLAAWRGLGRTVQERRLTPYSGVAGDAASWAVATGDRPGAVGLLEAGRGVLWTQLLDVRGDLAALRDAAPALFGRLDLVRAQLDRHREEL